MNKIKVGETIAFAYRFTFGNIGTVIGLIWLPVIALCVMQFFFMNYYTAAMGDIVTDTNPAAIGPLVLVALGYFLVALFLLGLIGAAITRQALGLRTGPAILYFSIGTAELSLSLSYLAAGLVVFVLYVGLFIAVALFGTIIGAIITASGVKLAPATAQLALVGGAAAAYIVVLCVLIYIIARLTFFLAPVAVAEGKIDLIRAWTLARRSFWRIFVVGLAIFVPIMLVAGLAQMAIVGPSYYSHDVMPTAGTAASMRELVEQLRAMSAHEPFLLGLTLLLAPFVYGLMFAAPAYAYKMLASSPPAQSPDLGPIRPA